MQMIRMVPGLRCAAVFAALLSAGAGLAQAQDVAQRSINGKVTDAQHEPLRGAVVQVENEDTHAVMSYITSRSGVYMFHRLRADTDYRVWTTYRGTRSRAREISKFDRKLDRTVNLTVRLP